MRSTTFGEPSVTLCTVATGMPMREIARAVPAVATSSNPID